MRVKETVAGVQAKEINLRYPTPGILYFNGVSDRISIPYAPENNPNSFTVEMWVQYIGGGGYRSILTSVSGSTIYGRRGYVLCVNPTGHWQFWLGSGQMANSWNIITGSKAKEGAWTHLAGMYDLASQTMTFYVNGQVVGQHNRVYFQPNHDNPLHIGAGAAEQPGASNCFFHGRIRALRIVTGIMNSGEIQSLAMKSSKENYSLSQEISSISPLLSCDGRGDYVQIAYASLLNPNQFTVSCWVNLRGGQDKWRSAIASRNDEPPKGYAIFAGENNRWQFWIGVQGGWAIVNGPDVVLNTWTLVSATFDGAVMRLYVNGELTAQRIVNNFVANSSRPLRIGAGSTEGNPKYFLPGQIASVRIWNRACATEEIQNQMRYHLVSGDPGLIGYWPLNEGVGTIVMDRTGNGNHGIMPSYVEIPYASAINPNQFSVTCWINVQGRQGTWRCAIASSDDGPPRGYIIYAGEDNRWQFAIGSGEGGWSTVSGSAVLVNTRTFLAATYSGGQMRFYVNGELVGERTANYVVNWSRPLRIKAGSTEGNPAYFLLGQISEVRIWSRACNQQEIRNEMNSLNVGEAPGLVGYWPVTESEGALAIDQMPNGNHGKIVRATWERAIGLGFIKKQ